MNINELKNRRIGMVLSGGGAKGAYQVGMFRALEELGLAGSISAMSGTSIGAFAEVIYTFSGWEAYRAFLHDFPKLNSGTILSAEEVEAAKAAVRLGGVSKEQFCSERRFRRFESEGLRDYFTALFTKFSPENRSVPLTVCCYSVEDEKPEYFRLGELAVEDRINAVIGSASLPYLFSPQLIGSSHYLDGGVIPDICTHPAPADKIPLLPMTFEDVDAIIINYLMPTDQCDLSIVKKGIPVIELRPSEPLEERPGSGTSDFSAKSLIWREELGYKDTMVLFSNMI